MTREPRQLALRRKAEDLDEKAANLLSMRGKAVLKAGALALREAANIYDLDPTLEDCPANRERDLDLIEEMCRQLWPMCRSAARGDSPWEDAEAMSGRLPDLWVKARTVVRTDHHTPEGSAAISHMWLIRASGYIREAGEHLREAIAKAGSLPYVTPEVAELAALADELIARAERLEAQR
jgi:hypothetical protein